MSFLGRARLLPHVNFTLGAEVQGHVFRVPVRQGVRIPAVEPEPWMFELIQRLVAARRGSFVDVGVNLGQTLLKFKAVDPEGRYFGFEPNPRCYCYVSEVIALNQLRDCAVYPFALGEKPAVVHLFHSSATDQAASVVEGFRPSDHYSARQFATVFPGDAILEPSDRPISIIKIDVEGGERDVLRGLAKTIDRERPFIICEVLPVYEETTENGKFRLSRQKEIEAFLNERQYSIHRLDARRGLAGVDEFGIHGDMSMCNYLFAPREHPV